jgi:hypothetical protein
MVTLLTVVDLASLMFKVLFDGTLKVKGTSTILAIFIKLKTWMIHMINTIIPPVNTEISVPFNVLLMRLWTIRHREIF